MTNTEIQDLVITGTPEAFDMLKNYIPDHDNMQDEVVGEDRDGDLTTLKLLGDNIIEYKRRSIVTDKDGVDDGVFGMRLTLEADGTVTKTDIPGELF